MIDNSKYKNIFEYADKALGVYLKLLDETYKRKKEILETIAKLPLIKDDITINNLIYLLDYQGLVIISMLDSILISKKMYESKIEWEKIYFSKQSYLIVYESLKSFNTHNKRIKEIVANFKSDFENTFTSIAQRIKSFKKTYKYETEISIIRNNVSGHINDKFDVYYNHLQNMLKLDAITMTKDFIVLMTELEKFCTLIFRHLYKIYVEKK